MIFQVKKTKWPPDNKLICNNFVIKIGKRVILVSGTGFWGSTNPNRPFAFI